jgi:hypothetical protein
MEFRQWFEVFGGDYSGIVWFNDETEQPIPHPQKGVDVTANFEIGGETYAVHFEGNNTILIWFASKRRGVYLTKANMPIPVLNKVLGAIDIYLKHCSPNSFYFQPESQKRGIVFDKLLQRSFQNYLPQGNHGFTRKDLVNPTDVAKATNKIGLIDL